MKSKITDMTSGSVVKHILKFALPLLLGNLFQQLYNLVDSIIVGKFVSADAFSAVGACGSIGFLLFSLNIGLSTGIGIIVAQYFGAKNYDKVKTTIANAVYVLMSVAVLILILGLLFAPVILKLLKTPDELINDSITYLRTSCTGIIAIAVYNGVSSILRALGDSKTPLYFLILSSITNICLDLLFVIVFKWGVFGVAFATVISQIIAATTSLTYAYIKVPYFHLTKAQMKYDKEIVTKSFKLGIPVALQNSLIAISCMVLQGVVNSFGKTVMAAYTITNRVEQVINQPYSSLSMALTTYSGQNMGAGRIDRVKKGLWKGIIIVTIFSAVMLPVMYLFGEGIAGMFVDGAKEPLIIEMGAQALRITSVCYLGLGMIYVPRAVLNGVGDTGFSMINGITEVLCRITYSQVFTRIASIGHWGIWITSGATWITTAIICVMRYASGKWKSKSIVDVPNKR